MVLSCTFEGTIHGKLSGVSCLLLSHRIASLNELSEPISRSLLTIRVGDGGENE
jgi:hypothetical protein